tara:strand:+ start:624 stop:1112 length:489 start_codon:yes stop_codon:yes gene_type:complete
MKKRQTLTYGITLINKKYKTNEFYHYLEEPNNAIIIPLLGKKFILVKQKREPINKNNIEFPMGWIDKGEKSINAAKRELLEETGYKSLSTPKKLIEFYADPGRGTRSSICYYTKKLVKSQKPEKDIKIALYNKFQLIKLIEEKKFNNASHIAAFFYFINKNY